MKSFNPVLTSTFRHVSNDNSEVCQYGDWPNYNSSCAVELNQGNVSTILITGSITEWL